MRAIAEPRRERRDPHAGIARRVGRGGGLLPAGIPDTRTQHATERGASIGGADTDAATRTNPDSDARTGAEPDAHRQSRPGQPRTATALSRGEG